MDAEMSWYHDEEFAVNVKKIFFRCSRLEIFSLRAYGFCYL
jgi:hypothetical protein